ncbi:MAG: TetR/AcrR family transcriptional regulator [Rickettsiales bacterium]|nr:TetR/AcrR family transcriptional regulator [Rickettsiales bacterium]
MSNPNKRERLIDSASILFHQRGMHATSLADIAAHADIPIGNVYYYFKTKEELALAAIAKRKEQFTAAYMVLDENIPDPRQRLVEALNYFDKVRDEYTKYGCPIGRTIEDGRADKDQVSATAANIFEDFVQWAKKQFEQLGHNDQAQVYATSLMAGIQGGTVMAKAFSNSQVITDEIARLTAWVQSLPNKRISLGKVGFMKATADKASDAA